MPISIICPANVKRCTIAAQRRVGEGLRVATFVALTTLAAAGGYQLTNPWLDRYANIITAIVLIVIGALTAAHVL